MASSEKRTAKSQQFHTSARITVGVSIPVNGKSFEEAIENAKKLKIEDFITIDGEYWDGDGPNITGIYTED